MGAVEEDGNLYIAINSRWPWEGELLFDRPRHKEYFGIPTDYARLNQFPEWFTVEQGVTYRVMIKQGERKDKKTMSGSSLIEGLPIALDKDGVRIRVNQN